MVHARSPGWPTTPARCMPGDLFFCIVGTVTDGHPVRSEAVAAGAVALCCERPTDAGVPEIVVSDSRRAMGRDRGRVLRHPSDEMLVLGVTGTNGKTTTAYLLESILAADGRDDRTDRNDRDADRRQVIDPGVRTTPESLDLQLLFAEMASGRERGRDGGDLSRSRSASRRRCALRERRLHEPLAGPSRFPLDDGGLLRGQTRCSSSRSAPTAAPSNVDDPYGRQAPRGSRDPVRLFGVVARGATSAPRTSNSARPARRSTIATPKGDLRVETALVGAFNVSNCLAAAAMALQAGIELDCDREGTRRPRGPCPVASRSSTRASRSRWSSTTRTRRIRSTTCCARRVGSPTQRRASDLRLRLRRRQGPRQATADGRGRRAARRRGDRDLGQPAQRGPRRDHRRDPRRRHARTARRSRRRSRRPARRRSGPALCCDARPATSSSSPARVTRPARSSPTARSRSTIASSLARLSEQLGWEAAPMTNIMIAGLVGILVTLFGTPLAIKRFRRPGWGQLIREEGPKAHYEKHGTPTMGGLVILAGDDRRLPRRPLRDRRMHPFRDSGLLALGTIVALCGCSVSSTTSSRSGRRVRSASRSAPSSSARP